MEVSLRPLDADNSMACWNLTISDEQRQIAFLDDMHTILKNAVEEKALIKLVIFDDIANVAIGYAQIRSCPADMRYDIGKFLIDERFQGKGYGTAALKVIVGDLFARNECHKITVTYLEFNLGAANFYKKAGFVEVENDDGLVHTELVREGRQSTNGLG